MRLALAGAALISSVLAAPALAEPSGGAAAVSGESKTDPASLPADKVKADPPKTDASPGAEKKPAAWETAKAEHRSGFAIGLSVGVGLGASNGYPSDSKKIGRSRYLTQSGLGVGTGSGIWLGGALADWLNFGFGFGFSQVFRKGSTSPAPLGFFHGDVYPLYPLKGLFRDLGATFDFGLGFPKTIDTKTEETLIDGPGASFVFAGAFFEPLKVWKMRMGPFVGVHYLFSQSIRRPLALGGFRLTLYSGP